MKNPRIGQVVIHATLDDISTIKEYTITKINTVHDTVTVNNNKELVFYTAFVWPVEFKQKLIEIITKRQELKKAYDDSIKLVYELNNEITRQGY